MMIILSVTAVTVCLKKISENVHHCIAVFLLGRSIYHKKQYFPWMMCFTSCKSGVSKRQSKDSIFLQDGNKLSKLLLDCTRCWKLVQEDISCNFTRYSIEKRNLSKTVNVIHISHLIQQKPQIYTTQLRLYHTAKVKKLLVIECIDIQTTKRVALEQDKLISQYMFNKTFEWNLNQQSNRKHVDYFRALVIRLFIPLLYAIVYQEKSKARYDASDHLTTSSCIDGKQQYKKVFFQNVKSLFWSDGYHVVDVKGEEKEFGIKETNTAFLTEWEGPSVKNLSPPVLLPPNFQGDVKREVFRLITFQDFSSAISAHPPTLANGGFYFTGRNDLVQCFSCLNVVSAQASRNPFDPIMHIPNCDFQRLKSGCGNIPLDAPPLSHDSAYGSFSSAEYGNNPNTAEVLLKKSASNLRSQTYQSAQPRNAPITPPIPPVAHEGTQQLATIHDPAHERLVRELNLCRESDRYVTFQNWNPTSPKPHPRALAKAGFFYLGNLDRTQCFSCGGVLRDWGGMDNPSAQHSQYFSNCAMAQGRSSRNVPEVSFQHQGQSSSLSPHLTEEEQHNIRLMFPCDNPATPRMQHKQDRIQTFINWSFTRATPNMMAEAGFFSLGVRDRAKCYYCNGGLQNWRFYDDPWQEHAKWFPTCEYLLRCKGPEFVHSVVSRYPNISRPPLRAPGQDVPPTQHMLPNGHSTSAAATASSSKDDESVEMELLKASLETDVAKTVVGMGYELSSVKEVNKRRIAEQGRAYDKAVDLLEAVMKYEDESSMEVNTEIEPKTEGEPSPSQPSTHGVPGSSPKLPDVAGGSMSTSAVFKSPPTQFHNGIAEPVAFVMNNNGQLAGGMKSEEEPQRVQEKETAPKSMSPSSHNGDLTPPPPTEAKGAEDRHLLESKFEEMLDEQLCKVCLDRKKEVLFFPCNHLCCCIECSVALRNCPMCRTKIEKGMRIYTSY